jgi:hypothetical protein
LEQLVLFVFKVEGRKSKSTLGGVSGKFFKVLSVRVAVSGKSIFLKSHAMCRGSALFSWWMYRSIFFSYFIVACIVKTQTFPLSCIA